MAVSSITPTQRLQRYLIVRPPTSDDHLWFFGGRLLSDETLRDQLARWGKRCNVKVTPHQLRHTFATQLINHGLPIESVRNLLGHKTLNMTQHYARLYDGTVKQQFASAVEAMEGIFVKDWPSAVTISQDTYYSPQVVNSV